MKFMVLVLENRILYTNVYMTYAIGIIDRQIAGLPAGGKEGLRHLRITNA
jgi:hypothetical protein